MDKDAYEPLLVVLENSNCSGCGACARLGSNLEMRLDRHGYARPHLVDGNKKQVGLDSDTFTQICPGVSISARIRSAGCREDGSSSNEKHDPIFGPYLEMWVGWATDPEIRSHGSSGGVLTALSKWMLESRGASKVVAARQGDGTLETEASAITFHQDLLKSAGSRYSPVGAAERYSNDAGEIQIGKPCEIYASSATERALDLSPAFKLSFFCAGTPSQLATTQLASRLKTPDSEISVRYRGHGCPGDFVAEGGQSEVRVPYREAWSDHLGPTIQWRCKICVDGTGEFADISVGDYWQISDRGYPLLEETAGESVVVVRTEAGRRVLSDARDNGIVALFPVDMTRLRAAQPAQVLRRKTLGGRLIGTAVFGRKLPEYTGFGVWAQAIRHPWSTGRAAFGTWRRLRKHQTGSI